MADGTKIEWTDATWNPITGCSVVSPGCTNCYAMRLAGTRMKNHWSRKGLTTDSKAGPVWNGQVRFNEEWLLQPLAWTRPRLIFVCAHADIFHEGVPDEWIDKVFAVMALAPQHTYQVLTKRSARMRAWAVDRFTNGCRGSIEHRAHQIAREANIHIPTGKTLASPEPFPHIWLGVSAEDQARADERIPDLVATPAAIRWCSGEPLLGPLDLSRWLGVHHHPNNDQSSPHLQALVRAARKSLGPALDWFVAGGESGPSARPVHPDWIRSLRDQCKAAGVPFHFKQWGGWAPWDDDNWSLPDGWDDVEARDAAMTVHGVDFLKVGKKLAGRLLDGVFHDEYPEARK
jgi:protein gp37